MADPGGRPTPIDLTNFCINVKSNPRMHQNPPFSGKNSIFFWGAPFDRPPPHYEILDPLLGICGVNLARLVQQLNKPVLIIVLCLVVLKACVPKLCVQLYSCCPVWQLVVHLLHLSTL